MMSVDTHEAPPLHEVASSLIVSSDSDRRAAFCVAANVGRLAGVVHAGAEVVIAGVDDPVTAVHETAERARHNVNHYLLGAAVVGMSVQRLEPHVQRLADRLTVEPTQLASSRMEETIDSALRVEPAEQDPPISLMQRGQAEAQALLRRDIVRYAEVHAYSEADRQVIIAAMRLRVQHARKAMARNQGTVEQSRAQLREVAWLLDHLGLPTLQQITAQESILPPTNVVQYPHARTSRGRNSSHRTRWAAALQTHGSGVVRLAQRFSQSTGRRGRLSAASHRC